VYILDTHALIWWLTDDAHLPARVRKLIADPAQDLGIATASLYECAYKYKFGKVPIDVSVELPDLLRRGRFRLLDMTWAVAVRAGRLPNVHRDPWDRIIAAHGIEADCAILTVDEGIAALGAKTVW
jgi:PIN domain nuclease of toxin-antitoxin system